jgi:RHS repeat-associated protein
VDDLVLRDRDTEGNGALEERFYALQDGNWNVAAIAAPSGAVQERFAYDAYGTPTVLTPVFANRSSSSFAWEILYAGYRWDAEARCYQVRNRVLVPGFGWIQRDPVRGDPNLYRYCYDRPTIMVDPQGLYSVAVTCTFSNGSQIWSETNWCDSSVTPGSCCASRAKGLGWGTPWTVLGASYGESGSECKFYIQKSGVGREAAGDPTRQCTANCLEGHWNLVSSCHGMVWWGRGGPGSQPWSMDPNLLINQNVIGYSQCRQKDDRSQTLKWGSAGVQGKSCHAATANDIADCVRHKPRQEGDWTIFNNCQTDVKEAVLGCCLSCDGVTDLRM